MTTDIKELVQWLRGFAARHYHLERKEKATQAALALEAMAGEVERLTTNGIHSCWEECPRFPCVQGREIRALTAERDRLKGDLSIMRLKLEAKLSTEQSEEVARLKAALEGMVHYATHAEWWQDAHPEYLEAARKALGGDAS